VLIAPEPGPLTEASAEVTTPAGRITSRWTVRNGKFRLTARVPKGVEATAILPSGAMKRLRAGKQTLAEPWPASARPPG
jgi:alpha-L-rhamnosidase